MSQNHLFRRRQHGPLVVLLGWVVLASGSCCPTSPPLPSSGTYTISEADDSDVANGEARIDMDKLTVRYVRADGRSVVVVFRIEALAK